MSMHHASIYHHPSGRHLRLCKAVSLLLLPSSDSHSMNTEKATGALQEGLWGVGRQQTNVKTTSSAYSNGRLICYYKATLLCKQLFLCNKMEQQDVGLKGCLRGKSAHSASTRAWVQIPSTHIIKLDVTGMPVTSTFGGKDRKTPEAHWPANLWIRQRVIQEDTWHLVLPSNWVCRNTCICTLINISHTYNKCTQAHTQTLTRILQCRTIYTLL